jgi:hypothetical protein
MSVKRTKSFVVSDHDDLERVDGWWANLLRKGPKEITDVMWESNGDLVWTLKLTWGSLDIENMSFNVCMPAYAGMSVEDLHGLLASIDHERLVISKNRRLFKNKIEDWEVIESGEHNHEYDEYNASNIMDFGIDPTLSYASKLDVVDKIMVSEFLWPCYKAMTRAVLMCETRIEEIKREIVQRADPTYTVVHVDRGMLRNSFIEQIGYDNKWLFASDDEIFEDYIGDDDPEGDVDGE